MRRLLDGTGSVTRVAGLGGLLLLVTTAATLRELPPERTAPVTPAGTSEPLPQIEPVPRPGTGRIQALFPTYPQARVIPMGLLEANGNPMEMAYFETPHRPGEVLEFYAREFRRRSERVVNQPDGAGGGAVSYYDARRGSLVSVTAIGVEGAQPRTMVFPSIVEAPEGIHLQGSTPHSLPRPPGATTVMRLDDRNPGPSRGSMTVTEVAHGTPALLTGFYREQLAALGYAQTHARSASHGVELLTFEKPGERLSFSLSPVSKKGMPESLITVVLERTSPSAEPTR